MEKLGKISKAALLALTLTMATLMASIQATNAAKEAETYAFICVVPNPIGRGQAVYVYFWLSIPPPTAAGAGGDRWRNMTVTIWKPDNTTEIKGPFTSDAVGIGYFHYTVDQIGTYYFQMHFDGQILQAGENPNVGGLPYVGWYFKPSTSPKVSLTVQEEQVSWLPAAQLPSGYWERPIYGENREWWSISGNWLQNIYNASGNFVPYTKTPETGHIVWTRELATGGLIGGEFGEESYYQGMTYEAFWANKVIMNGILYYAVRRGSASLGWYAVDLRTGETLWFQNHTSLLTLGQIYCYESPNQHGGIPYLWSIETNRYRLYDAFTGIWILDLAPSRSGVNVMSPTGDLLVYILDGTNNWLAMWNSSKAIPPAGPTGSAAWQWRPFNYWGKTLDWKAGIQWNVTIPKFAGPISFASCIPGQALRIINNDLVIASATLPATEEQPQQLVELVAFSLKKGEEGNVLWAKNLTLFPIWSRATFSPVHEGVFCAFVRDTMQWYGFNAYTGEKIWGPTEPYENAWGMYASGVVCAYGKLYASAYDGRIHCYDIKTGNLLWTFFTGSSGFETAYGHYPFAGDIAGEIIAADGKIYAWTGEHSPTQPMWRGAKLYCINATTGDLIWSISGWYHMGCPAVADGYLVAANGYDNRLYCFGKGLTQTTLSVQNDVVAKGSSILIKGTVTDLSPAVKGTPCVSDDDMSSWMEYLVMQKPMPQTVKGVSVEVYAIAEDGTTTKIGTATTDPLNGGIFSILWTPPEKGTYTITAVFAGSKSYWDSYTSTVVGVVEAPAPSATAEQVESTQNAIQNTVQALQPLITALIVLVVIAIVISIYSIYDHRKLRKQS